MTVFLQPATSVLVSVSMTALQFSRESYTVFPLSTDIAAKALQPSKTSIPIDVTLLGMVTDVRPVQKLKASLPIDFTLLGMVNDFRPVQFSKALSPMPVTLLGMTVFMQPEIIVLVAVSMIALQFSRESYTVFPLSTDIDVRAGQPENDVFFIDFTLLGMVIDVRFSHT